MNEPCECCREEFPVETMAFETLELDACLKVWVCEKCLDELKKSEAK